MSQMCHKRTSVRAAQDRFVANPLCSALFRRQQCQQGDTADDGENRAIDKYSCMANVVPQ